MSHFSVLVIAADHEAALQPFHEFECTGTNDQFVQEVDKTTEIQERIASGESIEEALDYYGLGEKIVEDENQVQKQGDDCAHKYGYAIVKDGKLIKAVDRTNPNKTWDWWVIGGRFGGKLTLKTGEGVSQALAGDVDWDAMVKKAADHASASYDSIMSVVGDRTVNTWADTYKRVEAKEITIDEARATYNGQSIIKELIEKKVIDSRDGAEELSKVIGTEREKFIKRESETNSTTWAMLHNGEWSERGRMGWWATSDATDESTADYATKFWKTVRSLPADMLVTQVDCHI